MIGETGDLADDVAELCCNLDDMTPEELGFAQERLWEAGALDVYTISIGMKKNRPGIMLVCMCRMSEKETFIKLLFKHTTTLGIREYRCGRHTLQRQERTVETESGPVRVKESSGWGVTRNKAEYEDLAEIARAKGISLREARNLVR